MHRIDAALLVLATLACTASVACGDGDTRTDATSTTSGGGATSASTSASTSSSTSTSSGTGGGHEVGVDYRSGDRLRAFVLDGGPGAIEFQFFVDTQLDAPCVFARDATGTYRCIPGDSATDGYADATCSTPLARASEGQCGAPHFVRRALPGSRACTGTNPASHFDYVWERFEAIAVGAAHVGTVYVREGNDCVPTSGPADGYFTLGQAVDPATFVEATETWEARGDRAELQVLTATDGAMIQGEARDAATDEICEYVSTTDDEGRICLPSFVAYRGSDLYADASCSGTMVTEVPADATGLCQPPTVVYSMVDETLYEIGADVPRADVYLKAAGPQCLFRGDAFPDAFTFRAVGAAVPADRYFTAMRGRHGGGALQVSGLDLPTGEILSRGAISYDTIAQQPCTLGMVQGEARCIYHERATVIGDRVYYRDPACTQRAAMLDEDPADAGVKVVSLADATTEHPTDTCAVMPYAADWWKVQDHTELYVATPFTGQVYEKALDACAPSGGGGFQGYALDPAPPETFQPIAGRLE